VIESCDNVLLGERAGFCHRVRPEAQSAVQARAGRFEVVENLGPIDPQERLVGMPVLAG